MKIVKIIFFNLCFLSLASSQSFFKGSATLGVNVSQIDGDNLAGYDKFGFTGGVKVEFPLNAVLDLGIEFLFSQRGSRSQLIQNRFTELSRIHLNYVELPLVIKWSDWWIEKDSYYKFNLHGGISNGYLISSNTDESPTPINAEINNYDVGLLAGLGFAFTKKWGLTLRYTRSLNTLYTVNTGTTGQVKGLIGYFITLRSEYSF